MAATITTVRTKPVARETRLPIAMMPLLRATLLPPSSASALAGSSGLGGSAGFPAAGITTVASSLVLLSTGITSVGWSAGGRCVTCCPIRCGAPVRAGHAERSSISGTRATSLRSSGYASRSGMS